MSSMNRRQFLGLRSKPNRAKRPPNLTAEQDASRFLAQSTFGADTDLIRMVATTGIETWMAAQFNTPTTYFAPIHAPLFAYDEEDGYFSFIPIWWQVIMTAPDQLRQRVAFALSEILVISGESGALEERPVGLSYYYDLLLDGAFGNFRDLLLNVSLSPAMGNYLSHLGNRKYNAETGQFPDENYAREIMQLFSIGLFELNMDGTQKLDGNGDPIPTYDNDDIREMAKVFTGLTYHGFDNEEDFYYSWEAVMERPMVMYAPEHDMMEKQVLMSGSNGMVIPAGQTPMQDINDAIDTLFNHPNTPPFICRQLIQRLVKSNPTPAYIERVANTFADNGSEVRGDMQSVVYAILMDDEARNLAWFDDPTHGMLREPVIRFTAMIKALNPVSSLNSFFANEYGTWFELAQMPMFAPSVFNFFRPDFSPNGAIKEAGLIAPEFQIMTSVTSITAVNFFFWRLEDNLLYVTLPDDQDQEIGVESDLTYEMSLLDDSAALLDHLNTLLTYGTLSQSTRTIILNMIDDIRATGDNDDDLLLNMIIHAIVISPDFVVLR